MSKVVQLPGTHRKPQGPIPYDPPPVGGLADEKVWAAALDIGTIVKAASDLELPDREREGLIKERLDKLLAADRAAR